MPSNFIPLREHLPYHMKMRRNGREPILQAAGYAYNFNRLAYYNREARKVFAVEWVRDHTAEEVQEAVETPNESDDWEIYADRRRLDGS